MLWLEMKNRLHKPTPNGLLFGAHLICAGKSMFSTKWSYTHKALQATAALSILIAFHSESTSLDYTHPHRSNRFPNTTQMYAYIHEP